MPDRLKSFGEINVREDRSRARPRFVKPIRNGLRKGFGEFILLCCSCKQAVIQNLMESGRRTMPAHLKPQSGGKGRKAEVKIRKCNDRDWFCGVHDKCYKIFLIFFISFCPLDPQNSDPQRKVRAQDFPSFKILNCLALLSINLLLLLVRIGPTEIVIVNVFNSTASQTDGERRGDCSFAM